MKKRFVVIPLLVVFFVFLWKYKQIILMFVLGLVFTFLADWDVQKKISSPDGKYVAECLVYNGGAMTSYSPQVSLRKSYTIRFHKRGNIFIGYRSRYIDIEWKDDKTLIIHHNCEQENIFKQEDVYGNIQIEYIKR